MRREQCFAFIHPRKRRLRFRFPAARINRDGDNGIQRKALAGNGLRSASAKQRRQQQRQNRCKSLFHPVTFPLIFFLKWGENPRT